jgi:hypothetical protein
MSDGDVSSASSDGQESNHYGRILLRDVERLERQTLRNIGERAPKQEIIVLPPVKTRTFSLMLFKEMFKKIQSSRNEDYNQILAVQTSGREFSYNKYFKKFSEHFAPQQDLSFMDYFKEIADPRHAFDFIVPFEKLVEFGVKHTKSNRQKAIVKDLAKGIDYITEDVEVPNSKTRQKTIQYWFRPAAFKLLLMHSRADRTQKTNPVVFCNYFILVEQIHHMYQDYVTKFRQLTLDKQQKQLDMHTKTLRYWMDTADDLRALAAKKMDESDRAREKRRKLRDTIDDLESDILVKDQEIIELDKTRESLDIQLEDTQESYRDVGAQAGNLGVAVECMNAHAMQIARRSTCSVPPGLEPYFSIISWTDPSTGLLTLRLVYARHDRLISFIRPADKKLDSTEEMPPTYFANPRNLVIRGQIELEQDIKAYITKFNAGQKARIAQAEEDIRAADAAKAEARAKLDKVWSFSTKTNQFQQSLYANAQRKYFDAGETFYKCVQRVDDLKTNPELKRSDIPIATITLDTVTIEPNEHYSKEQVIAVYSRIIERTQCPQYKLVEKKRKWIKAVSDEDDLFDDDSEINPELERLNKENKKRFKEYLATRT